MYVIAIILIKRHSLLSAPFGYTPNSKYFMMSKYQGTPSSSITKTEALAFSLCTISKGRVHTALSISTMEAKVTKASTN